MNHGLSRQRILIVDDSMTNIVALDELLRGDYEVKYVTGSEQGLEACRTLQPDLVLLDVVMPGLDGFAVTDLGRLLIRNIAMRFDAYNKSRTEGKFSRTI